MTLIDVNELVRRSPVRRRRSRILIRPPTATIGLEMDMRRVLYEFLERIAREADNSVLPEAARTASELIGDASVDIAAAVDRLRRSMDGWTSMAIQSVTRIMELRAQRFDEGFVAKARSALGIDLSSVVSSSGLGDEFNMAAQRNAGLIRSLGEDSVKRVQQSVVQGVLRGETHRDLQRRLAKEIGTSRSRAKLIARDQSQKLTSDLNRIRQRQIGVEKYEWSTSRDERVRPSHAVKEGQEYSWDDPPPDTGHPGEDIQCRCVALAVVQTGVEESEPARAPEPEVSEVERVLGPQLREGQKIDFEFSMEERSKSALNLDKFDESEVAAVKRYYGDSSSMNGYLRGTYSGDNIDEVRDKVAKLDSAIAKSTAGVDTPLYRGIGNYKKISNFEPGDVIENKAYSSFSSNIGPGYAMTSSSSDRLIIRTAIKKNQRALFSNEVEFNPLDEYILPRDVSYRVLRKTNNVKVQMKGGEERTMDVVDVELIY